MCSSDLINELGPSIVMFSLGLWGTVKLIIFLLDKLKNYDKKIEQAEQKTEEANKAMINLLFKALDERDVIKQKEHHKAAEYRKEVMRKCDEYAKEIIKETNADQVAIYDYCNGTQSLSGIPFLHFRTIAEKEDIKSKKNMYSEKLDINTLGTFLLDLEREQMITIKNIKREEERYPELSHFMLLNKKHKGIYANVVGTDSSLGFISITYNHNKKVDYAKVEKVIYTYTQKISNLLDYSNINS